MENTKNGLNMNCLNLNFFFCKRDHLNLDKPFFLKKISTSFRLNLDNQISTIFLILLYRII